MLSLTQLRELIGHQDGLSDAQLTELGEKFYELARALVDSFDDPTLRPCSPCRRSSSPLLRLVPPHQLEEVEERAAIREFEGHQRRREAERGAMAELGLMTLR